MLQGWYAGCHGLGRKVSSIVSIWIYGNDSVFGSEVIPRICKIRLSGIRIQRCGELESLSAVVDHDPVAVSPHGLGLSLLIGAEGRPGALVADHGCKSHRLSGRLLRSKHSFLHTCSRGQNSRCKQNPSHHPTPKFLPATARTVRSRRQRPPAGSLLHQSTDSCIRLSSLSCRISFPLVFILFRILRPANSDLKRSSFR